jgi:predicted DNA-binding protein
MADSKKLSIRLTPEVIEKLRRLADEQGITLDEALRKAIDTEDFVRTQVNEGSKIVIEKPNQTFTEVVFR